MKLKQFIVYSIIYIGVVGILVFIQNGTSYTASFFNLELMLPVALWFILPLILFALFAIFHITVHNLSFYLDKRAIKHDSDVYDDYAKDILLGIESNKNFKTQTFKVANEVTRFLSPWHDNSFNSEDEEINSIIDMLKRLNNGEVVDLKKYKLPSTNPLVIKNEFNKLENDNLYANVILKNKKELDDDISKRAYQIMLTNSSYNDIKKYDIKMSKEDIEFIINKYLQEDNFEVTRDDLYNLISMLDLNKDEYVSLANRLKEKVEPDVLIAMFDRLKDEKENATEAYLYLLYEFGMIEKLKEILTYKQEGEYEKFEALVFLKDAGKQIPASYFYK